MSLQVPAAIYERFPECGLFRRMKVSACPDARHFLDTWPRLIAGTERELEVDATIASTFSEANTLMSLVTRQKVFETAPRVQTAQLNVLTHRTEPLSPSRKRSGAPDSPVPCTSSLTPEREREYRLMDR